MKIPRLTPPIFHHSAPPTPAALINADCNTVLNRTCLWVFYPCYIFILFPSRKLPPLSPSFLPSEEATLSRQLLACPADSKEELGSQRSWGPAPPPPIMLRLHRHENSVYLGQLRRELSAISRESPERSAPQQQRPECRSGYSPDLRVPPPRTV